MKFAERMDRFGEGIFSRLAELKRQKLEAGENVVDLSIGAPNIPPAQHILDVLCKEAADKNNYIYAINDQKDLLQAVSQWYERRYGVNLDPDTEICSLLGSQEGLAHIAMSIVDEGDLVLVPDPCYPVFADGPRLAGAELYYMPQKKENGYVIRLSDIPEEVAQRAKFMVVSYPNNPTAVMAPDSFYEELIAFAKKYDIIVLHDNAYSELVFDALTLYTVNHLDSVPKWLNDGLHRLFVGTMVLVVYLFYQYIAILVEEESGKPWKLDLAGRVYLAIAEAGVLVLPVHYAVTPLGNYSDGIHADVCYVSVGVYLLLCAAQLAMEGGRSMKLLRVLLVDDEINIREGFKRLFDWQAHGCEVVGEAADGVQALSQME